MGSELSIEHSEVRERMNFLAAEAAATRPSKGSLTLPIEMQGFEAFTSFNKGGRSSDSQRLRALGVASGQDAIGSPPWPLLSEPCPSALASADSTPNPSHYSVTRRSHSVDTVARIQKERRGEQSHPWFEQVCAQSAEQSQCQQSAATKEVKHRTSHAGDEVSRYGSRIPDANSEDSQRIVPIFKAKSSPGDSPQSSPLVDVNLRSQQNLDGPDAFCNSSARRTSRRDHRRGSNLLTDSANKSKTSSSRIQRLGCREQAEHAPSVGESTNTLVGEKDSNGQQIFATALSSHDRLALALQATESFHPTQKLNYSHNFSNSSALSLSSSESSSEMCFRPTVRLQHASRHESGTWTSPHMMFPSKTRPVACPTSDKCYEDEMTIAGIAESSLMYDSATWRMYNRITSARRRQMVDLTTSYVKPVTPKAAMGCSPLTRRSLAFDATENQAREVTDDDACVFALDMDQ